jgi:hypothetical protein
VAIVVLRDNVTALNSQLALLLNSPPTLSVPLPELAPTVLVLAAEKTASALAEPAPVFSVGVVTPAHLSDGSHESVPRVNTDVQMVL